MQITTSKLELGRLPSEESLYHTANGYIGIRGCFEEGYAEGVKTIRGSYINGFYDTIDIKYPEKLFGFPETAQRIVNLPDLQTTKLFFDSEEFSLSYGKILEYSRTLDMEAGVAIRRVHWENPKGKRALITFKRMASFVRRELFLTEITVEADNACALKIVSEANCDVHNFCDNSDPRVASERKRHISMQSAEICGNAAVALSETANSGLYVAAAMSHSVSVPAETRTTLTQSGFKTEITTRLGGKPVIISKYCTYSDSRRSADCKESALAALRASEKKGAERLFIEQRNYLNGFWDNCGILIHGDDKLAEGMAFNLYGLLQSAGRDSFSSIGSKGLSGEGYEGHYFWDTETYMLPFFTLTMPNYARTLLEYRYSVLDRAKEHARMLGHSKGALYPWRTITGSECSAYFPSGSAQYHINGDIAYAFMQYYYATRDIEFMSDKGADVLVETARFWLNAGAYDRKGRLCFNGVTGPDEYTCIVNNNYFTNISAKQNILGAVYICEELKCTNKFEAVARRLNLSENELLSFKKAAEDIYIPYDGELDINPQDDSFLDKEKWDLTAVPKENFPLLTHYHPLYLYRGQVCKQADVVLAHYMYGEAGEKTIRNSYEYYEPITTHDSSLSKCVFSIMASYLNMSEKAYDYFLDVVRTDLDDTHGNTKDGLHAANMGGAYLCVVAGFAGLRIRSDGLYFSFKLPKAWTGYEFNLSYLGRLLHVSVTPDAVEFKLKNGNPVSVFVDGKRVLVK